MGLAVEFLGTGDEVFEAEEVFPARFQDGTARESVWTETHRLYLSYYKGEGVRAGV